MDDNFLDKYIDKLLKINIEDSNFDIYIDVFSKFLGYIDSDYKYNGTFLSQYIDEFKNVYKSLKYKNEIYNNIFNGLRGIGCSFKISLDRVFSAKYSISDDSEEKRYVEINKNKIISDVIEVCVWLVDNDEIYLFHKEYQAKDNQLSLKVYKDVKQFMKSKGLRGINHGIA